MSRTAIAAIAAIAAGAVSLPGSAMGQDGSAVADSIQIKGAYAYVVDEPC